MDKEEIEHVLKCCKEKLQCYREQARGEYCGGVEYSKLIEMIDRILDGDLADG